MENINKELNVKELNLEDMKEANGGWNWGFSALSGIIGGSVGCMGAGTVALALCGPVGWAALGGAAVGAIAASVAGGFYEGN